MRKAGIPARSRGEGVSIAHTGKPWSDAQRAAHAVTRQTPEYREMMAAKYRGEKSHLWRGGKTEDDDLRLQRAWKQRRSECYERDNWTCQDCSVKCRNGVRIQAHHVLARRLGGSDDLDNLVTLCASCHQRRERKDVSEQCCSSASIST